MISLYQFPFAFKTNLSCDPPTPSECLCESIFIRFFVYLQDICPILLSAKSCCRQNIGQCVTIAKKFIHKLSIWLMSPEVRTFFGSNHSLKPQIFDPSKLQISSILTFSFLEHIEIAIYYDSSAIDNEWLKKEKKIE